ncbi:hypothetical protein Ancab_000287 [Ancistrocladus abbreviatus]
MVGQASAIAHVWTLANGSATRRQKKTRPAPAPALQKTGVEGKICKWLTGEMFRDKPAGVKILWIWTIGTAAVLVTNVVRTRVKDMEKIMDAETQKIAAPVVDSEVVVNSTSSDDEILREDKL